MPFKNNGPGGCCCAFCGSFDRRTTDLTDNFTSTISADWEVNNGLIVTSGEVRLPTSPAVLGYGNLAANWKSEKADAEFFLEVELSNTDADVDTYLFADTGSFDSSTLLFDFAFIASCEEGTTGLYVKIVGGSTTILTDVPADNDVMRVEFTPTATAQEYDISFKVNATEISSNSGVDISALFTSSRMCDLRLGMHAEKTRPNFPAPSDFGNWAADDLSCGLEQA
jgi:hypothetical protein